MNRYLRTIRLSLFVILQILTIIVVSCTLISRSYSNEDQHKLAESRIENMKEQLGLKITLEKEAVRSGDAIFFIAHFINKTNSPITLRVPQQSDVLDIWAPKIALTYSIIPLDKSISLETPLSILNSTPFMVGSSLLSNEFETLDSNSIKDVKLEVTNLVYLKQKDEWVESRLPPGQYWINLTYENLYIGYQVTKPDQIYYVDISAWVGKIKAEPTLLTIVP